jgi:hypothetical protein
MATWNTVYTINDGGTPVVYQQESTPITDDGTGAGNRHRLIESGIEYDPSPQGRPCRSPNYMAASFDPFFVLDQGQTGLPVVLRVTDVTP